MVVGSFPGIDISSMSTKRRYVTIAATAATSREQPSHLPISLSSNTTCRYWDWMLDAEDPASSPVLDPSTGFAGNGNINDEAINLSFKVPDFGIVDRHAFCVDDGPFSNLPARYNRSAEGMHCLARNFANDTAIGHFDGTLFSRDYVNEILEIDDYLSFTSAIEDGPHWAIHSGMGGDFESISAPMDVRISMITILSGLETQAVAPYRLAEP